MTLVIVIIVLAIVFGGGGHFYNGGAYRTGGLGIAGLLIVALVILFLSGAVHA